VQLRRAGGHWGAAEEFSTFMRRVCPERSLGVQGLRGLSGLCGIFLGRGAEVGRHTRRGGPPGAGAPLPGPVLWILASGLFHEIPGPLGLR